MVIGRRCLIIKLWCSNKKATRKSPMLQLFFFLFDNHNYNSTTNLFDSMLAVIAVAYSASFGRLLTSVCRLQSHLVNRDDLLNFSTKKRTLLLFKERGSGKAFLLYKSSIRLISRPGNLHWALLGRCCGVVLCEVHVEEACVNGNSFERLIRMQNTSFEVNATLCVAQLRQFGCNLGWRVKNENFIA